MPNIKFEKYNVVAPAQFETQEDSSAKQTEINDLTVRGRQFDQTKPETFNQVRYIIFSSEMIDFESNIIFFSYGHVRNSVDWKNY